jgi:hypothetical protein
MVTVVDYAFPPHPSTSALLAATATGVARYLSWLPNNKVITRTELQKLCQAGLGVILVWECGAQDFIGPKFDARAAATEAVRQANSLGYPENAALYYALDWDVTVSQWPMIRDRLRNGPIAVHGVERTGIYGPSDALEWARRDGCANWFWQAGMSTAWSRGRNRQLWPGAHLRQRRTTTIDGASCDLNDIIKSDYGQGGTPVDPDIEYGLGVAFARTYDGVHGISGGSWMAQAVERPLNTANDKLDQLLSRPTGNVSLTPADRATIIAEVSARVVSQLGPQLSLLTELATRLGEAGDSLGLLNDSRNGKISTPATPQPQTP